MTPYRETKALDWFAAKQRGERLPEHELSGDLDCPLCGEPLEIITQHGEFGPEQVGRCAACVTLIGVDL